MTGGYSINLKAYADRVAKAPTTSTGTLEFPPPRLDVLLSNLHDTISRVEANTNSMALSAGKLTGTYENYDVSDQKESESESEVNSHLATLTYQISRLNTISERLFNICSIMQENV